MAGSSFSDRMFGRSPAQQARQRRTLEHPVRSAILAGLMFGVPMGLVFGVAYGWAAGLVLGLLCAVLFGPAMVLVTRIAKHNDEP